MAPNAVTVPTPAELDILRVLWAKGPSSVRDVHEALDTGTGYTSTLKLMQMMHAKSMVIRDDSARQHIYAAALNEEKTVTTLVNRFAKTIFEGSVGALALHALGNGKTTREELAELKNLIRRKEKEQA